MTNLRTRYMGLKLAHPIVASSSPLAATANGVRELELHGAAAVVLPSLFEEQIRQEQGALDTQLNMSANTSPEATHYFVESESFANMTDRYLELVRQASDSCSIPVIASINGVSESGWVDIAKDIQSAGADALELNIYSLPINFSLSAQAIEDRYVAILKSIKQQVTIPVALKISPYFSSLGNIAKRFEAEGADALVMFNRFYQPDIDIESREVERRLLLSTESEVRLPLTWISLLRDELKLSLAATSGVTGYLEVVKCLMAGADVVMTASAILHHGPSYLRTMRDELREWMQNNGYQSVDQLRGCMSLRKVANPEAYERAQYMKLLSEFELP